MFINFDTTDNGVITVTPITFTNTKGKGSHPNDDAHDRCHETFTVSNADIFQTIVSMLFRLLAVGMNISLAVEYYNRRLYYNCCWTVLCIGLPMIVTTLIYLKM